MTRLLIRLFIKDFSDTANPRVRERYGKLAGLTGIATNLLLAGLKLAAGILFHSIAMTADAINNLTDSASSVVTLVGFQLAAKPADAKHPYGHARMEYIAGLIVSLVILVLGVELGRSSLDKILQPEPTDFNWLVIGVLSISILLKLWQCLFYRKMGRTIQSPTLMATSTDSLNDVVATSVILLGGIITRLTGFNLDGYLGMAVAIFISVSGIRLVIETSNPLLGLSPSPDLVQRLRDKISHFDGILGCHDLQVHEYGESVCYATVHCEMSADQDILSSHTVLDRLEREVFEEMGVHLVIHLDPVVVDDERTNLLKKQVQALLYAISPALTMHDFRVDWGEEATAIFFDVNVPFRSPEPADALREKITAAIQMLDPRYHAAITVDYGEDISAL